MSAMLHRVVQRTLEAPLSVMSAGIMLARDLGHGDVAEDLTRLKTEWARAGAKMLARMVDQ